MLSIVAASLLAFFATYGSARPSNALLLHPAERLANTTGVCNSTCATFTAAKEHCNTPHCSCTIQFLQAQGDCLVCNADTPTDAASVQFLLDAEMTKCYSEGIQVEFQLQLPSTAAAIVQEFNIESDQLRREQTAFLAVQIAGGHIGLPVVLLFPIFAHGVNRAPTFFNFCITWIFSSVIFSILLYRGTAGNTVLESLGVVPLTKCLAQAALINGAQVMTTCSTLALVIEIWLGLRAAIHHVTLSPKQTRWTKIALLVTPYVLFVVFTLPSILIGRQRLNIEESNWEHILPTNFYCMVVNSDSFLLAVYGVTLGLLVITIVLDVHIISLLYRHWRMFRCVPAKTTVSLSPLLRVIFFSIYRVVVAVAYGTVLNKPPEIDQFGKGDSLAVTFGVPIWVDMLQAAIPLVGFLVLGLNSEMISAFLFWRKTAKPLESVNHTQMNTVCSS